MKYYYEKPKDWIGAGKIYRCNHPRYNQCTLFQTDGRGIAVIQERFNEKTKSKWWGSVDPWLAGDIYFHEEFADFFEEHATEPDENGLYPTFPVRSIMWMLRMKPLKKQYWEEF